MSVFALLVLPVALLLASATITFIEAAYFSADRLALKDLEDSNRGARIALQILEHPEMLAVLLLTLNNAINIFYAYSATLFFVKVASSLPRTWQSIVLTGGGILTVLVLIFFGEALPKSFALYRGQKAVAFSAPFVRFLLMLASPLIRTFLSLTRLNQRAIDSESLEARIRAVAYLAHLGGSLQEPERKMIEGVFELQGLLVSDIMVPRVDIKALPATATVADAIALITRTGHSRIPIYEGSLDSIVGILYAKDILQHTASHPEVLQSPVRALTKEPYFVPETQEAGELFKDLRGRRIHLAVVVDEFGGTSGIVTMEDILEEIVGEIRDEYDLAEGSFYEILAPDHSSAIVNARIPIRKLNEDLGINISESETYDTVAGLLMDEFGRIPQKGESTKIGNIRVTVLDVARNHIRRVRIEKLSESE
ncbi:MAG: hemolysin family protein [bacterium JZ-2024 1]